MRKSKSNSKRNYTRVHSKKAIDEANPAKLNHILKKIDGPILRSFHKSMNRFSGKGGKKTANSRKSRKSRATRRTRK